MPFNNFAQVFKSRISLQTESPGLRKIDKLVDKDIGLLAY